LASISCEDAASELLRQSVGAGDWNPDLALQLGRPECADDLFRILIEGLADRFESRLCDVYAAIFSLILEHVFPELHAAELLSRYQRIRRPRPVTFQPKRVAVLSRVTLGADIAITSVLLAAAAKRFPHAEIWFAGSAKAAQLFAGSTRVQHLDIPYVRGTIPQRVSAWRNLAQLFEDQDWLVIDPDSRLTQLGLLPVAEDHRYLFFESRSYGGDSPDSLTNLAKQWAAETLGVEECENRIAPPPQPRPFDPPFATVSLGTSENPSKQMSPELERDLIRDIAAHFPNVIVDRGFGEEEAARVEHAIAGTGAVAWSGSFAAFASIIRSSACYVGYDSAGQHAAAAFGVPLITLFRGFVNDRMFARWQPTGPGPKQILKIHPGVADVSIAASIKAALSSSFSRL